MALRPDYSCTQQQLYAVGRAAWQNCNARLVDFTALKAKYTALFVTGKINAITAAENLPDNEQRVQAAALIRKQMSVKGEECRDKWQRLKLYIQEAFPANEIDTRLAAAGSSHYTAAVKENWDELKRLMIDGEQFITDNTAALSANDNMPAGFPLEFTTKKTEFETMYNDYVNASLNTEVQTQDKINANNAVYADLISMLKDGQRIYKKDEALRKLFTFDQVLNDVAGAGQAGLKGTVTDGVNPLEGVKVKIVEDEEETLADADGKYAITQLAAGIYHIEFSKAGYQTQIIEVIIEAGVTKTLDVVMVAAP
jgi:hypothetical protein